LNKKILATACLLASVSAPANEIDNLVTTSSTIASKLDLGIQYVGAATVMNATNVGIAPLGVQTDAHISSAEAEAYNSALQGMASFTAYTASQFLNDQGQIEIGLMNDAIDTFAEITVDLATVVQVSDMAVEAQQTQDVQQQENLQDFVSSNEQMLTISAEDIQVYNESLDDVASHAANAAAYIAVASDEAASAWLQEGADTAGVRFTDAADNLSFAHQSSAVLLDFTAENSSGYAFAVFMNGTDQFGIDIMASRTEVLFNGADSDFYLNGPTQNKCFFSGTDCNEDIAR